MPLKLSLVSNAIFTALQKTEVHTLMKDIGHIRSQHASSSMKEEAVHIGSSPGKQILEVGQLHIKFLLMLLLFGLNICSFPAHKSFGAGWPYLALTHRWVCTSGGCEQATQHQLLTLNHGCPQSHR